MEAIITRYIINIFIHIYYLLQTNLIFFILDLQTNFQKLFWKK
jgi:hypothetical protein